ncbi:glycosyltransferase family 4 protein [Rhizobiaceae bacterium BDR2-2]|uniref:Glycosyltransferase family 4 protein n=1 Tax=Ectorhizobium quercum TaxID=2965071 RepID=A0AAE3SW33_9HYPH|nr:glycosyltransferase family 4 protein [Ectorhizobium quercum]MCX8998960.1 glycosyltransferase family 4 protein [Ectorhizobium quercum]
MTEQTPLRIVHCFRAPAGGVFRHVRDLVDAHTAAGHQVGVLCDTATDGEHEKALLDALEPKLALGLIRMPIERSIKPSDITALKKAYDHIKSLQPDVLHGHGAKGGAIARIIGSFLRVNRYRVARLYSPHGGSLHFRRASLKGQVILRAERFMERFTDSLVFVCDYEKETYAARVGEPEVPWHRIHNGVSESEFTPVAKTAEGVDLLFIGNLRDLKGPDVFIDAFLRAERIVGRPLSGLIVGNGPQREDYARKIGLLGLGGRLGVQPAMPARDAFALTDIVVVPSRNESLPYIVLEALAADKAVIASRVGGIAEILGAASPALVPPGDADALAAVMARALGEPGWKSAAMPSADTLRASFSTPVMADAMLELYREALAEQAAG